jgi:hypothetical protein
MWTHLHIVQHVSFKCTDLQHSSPKAGAVFLSAMSCTRLFVEVEGHDFLIILWVTYQGVAGGTAFAAKCL